MDDQPQDGSSELIPSGGIITPPKPPSSSHEKRRKRKRVHRKKPAKTGVAVARQQAAANAKADLAPAVKAPPAAPVLTQADADLVECVCLEIADGKTLMDVFRAHPEWGDVKTIRALWTRLLMQHGVLFEMYSIAKQMQVSAMVDNAIEKSRDSSRDILEDEKITENPDGSMKVVRIRRSDNTAVQRDRLEVDTIKWYASKVYPRLFGDKGEESDKSNAPVVPILNITIEK